MSSQTNPGATHHHRIDPQQQLLGRVVGSVERNRQAPLTLSRTAANCACTSAELWHLLATHHPPRIGKIHLGEYAGEPVVLLVPIDMEPEE